MARPAPLAHQRRWFTLTLSSLALALALPASASPLDWFRGAQVQGNGHLSRQTRELPHFNGVHLSTGGKVEIRLGEQENISIEVDENIQPLLETVVEDGILRIRPLKKNSRLDTRSLKIVVGARSIDRIAVAGSGTVSADQLRANMLTLDIGGSGSIRVNNLECGTLTTAIGGSGDLQAGGKADRLKASIGGSGSIRAGKLAAREVSISIGGSGDATVWASQTLSASMAGSGEVAYYGDPKLSTSVVGSGSVKRLGSAPQ